jgi:hypothetical protein
MALAKIALLVALQLAASALADDNCPCSTEGGTLTCQPGIIYEFPEDVFKVGTYNQPVPKTGTGLKELLQGSALTFANALSIACLC